MRRSPRAPRGPCACATGASWATGPSVIWTLAWRSLMVHPVRSLVLACGFGLGVSVMATLLGVGDVILEQARSPALVSGGDVVIASATGRLTTARFLLANVVGAP